MDEVNVDVCREQRGPSLQLSLPGLLSYSSSLADDDSANALRHGGASLSTLPGSNTYKFIEIYSSHELSKVHNTNLRGKESDNCRSEPSLKDAQRGRCRVGILAESNKAFDGTDVLALHFIVEDV